MPKVRRRARLVVDGRTIEIETNALDLAKSERDGEGSTVMALRTLHHAAMRQKVEGVPIKFEAFLEQLDEFDDLDDLEADELGGDDADPIPARVSGHSP